MKKVYIFFRGMDWYPLIMKDDEEAIKNAKNNPGMTKVEDTSGKIIWEAK